MALEQKLVVDSSDDEADPTNREVMKVLSTKFKELERAITFNGEVMDQLQKSIKEIINENKHLKKRTGRAEAQN
nr:unnamed protein product [Callosobruchus analis]